MDYKVADYTIRLKNASLARRKEVVMPFSNLVKAIGKVLKTHGFLSEVREEVVEGKKTIVTTLRYENRKPVISDVEIVSKPSLRVHIAHGKIRKNHSKTITAILSTNKGIMTGREAQQKGIGGELLFKIW